LTGNTSDIRSPRTIACIATGIALIPAFPIWINRQEKLRRPAIIPNSLWRNRIFTSICLGVFLTWGAFNALENLMTFVFQYVQGISALQSSVRFLPAPVAGALTNVMIGLIVDRVPADRLITVGVLVSCISPLIMAVMKPKASYWVYEFPALALNPIGSDIQYTISNLVITSVFPVKTQALAGGVFNTVSQIGKSFGLATSAVIASTITIRSSTGEKDSTEALLDGYRAAFWYCFGLSALAFIISIWGLRNIGKVGTKRD
jgi:Na+/melibiose symporter-like transporter